MRIAMHVSIESAAKLNRPTAPAYAPRRSFSRSATSSIARILGAPETVPAGKMERKASNLSQRERQWPVEGERRAGNAPSESLAKDARDLGGEVHDVTELFDLHQTVDLDRLGLADAVDIVASEVNEHDVLCSILERREKGRSELFVLCGASLVQAPAGQGRNGRTLGTLASSHSSSDGVVRHDVLLDLAEAFGAGANEPDIVPAVDVEHVRRRVELAKMPACPRVSTHSKEKYLAAQTHR